MAWRGYGAQAGQPSWPQAAAQQPRPAAATTWAAQPGQPRPTIAVPSAAKPVIPARILPGGVVVPSSATAPAAGAASAAAADTYVVYTKGADGDEVVVRTLVGEYTEHGANHGRKVYKKSPDKSGEVVDVFLYYWDGRDGAAFEGWWFGNKLGGTQVWSHNTNSGLLPPAAGWKIPWDGAVRATLVVAPKVAPRPGAISLAPQTIAPGLAAGRAQAELKADQAGKLEAASREVTEATASAKLALEQAKAAAGDYTFAEGLKAAEQALQPQVQALAEVLKKLVEIQRQLPPDVARQMVTLGTQTRAMQNSVNTELAKLRASKAKAEQSEKQKVADEKDLQALQEVMPEAMQKANAAEDAVDKALITSEMIAAAGEELEEVRQAVTQTEQAATEAQKIIGEARIYLNAKQASCRRFESEKAKKLAMEELGKLQNQLQEAQNKLNPLKSVRQDYTQRAQAQKVVQEVLQKLSPAEVDVDRAEEATVLLGGEGASKESMKQAEQAVTKAGDHIGAVLRFIEQRRKTLQGAALTELVKMEERAKESQQRLLKLKTSQKEAAERVMCETLLKEAAEKLQAVAESVTKAADAEGPFLMGVEELPLAETLNAVKGCEAAATSANTAVSIARMFIATKLVEAKRFTAGPSQEALTKLKEYQAELESQTNKLNELKKSTAARKKAATMREAESEVQKAEDLCKKVAVAASILEDDAKIAELSVKEVRAASEETQKAEQAANTALAEARKLITAKQIEAKGKELSAEVSAELIKFQARLSSAQAEVSKYRKLSSSVEQRLAAKKVVEEATAKIKAAEEKVAKVAELAEAVGNEGQASAVEKGEGDKEGAENAEKADKAEAEKPTTNSKAAEAAAAEAQVALKTVARYLESHTRTPGTIKDEITKLQPQLKEVQDRLETLVAEIRARTEKAQADGLIKESEERVKDAEEHAQKVKAAEAPFKAAEDLPVEQASTALADLEAAVHAAHSVVGGAKTFLAMKRLAAKRLAEASAKRTGEELAAMQSRVEAAAKILADARKELGDRKSATVKREVASKAEEVTKKLEEAVQATKALCDGADNFAPLEMKAACEKAGTTQQEAQATIEAVRTLLLTRQREAKAAAADASFLSELSKLLDGLKASQAELDTQKGLLRDQEHKFVADRLLKEAVQHIEELEQKFETATQAAAPLTSDTADFSAAVFLSQVVDALKKHLQASKRSPKELFQELSEQKEAVSVERFVAFVKALPEVTSLKDAALTEDQIKAAFGRLDTKAAGEIKEEDLADQLRSRFLCNTAVTMTESVSVKGGKTVRKVEVGEVVEALEEPVKDEGVGLMRVRVKCEKDDKEGFISLAGNQGTVYLEPYLPHIAMQKKVERNLAELADNAKEVLKYVESKTEELKKVKAGPLADTKVALLKLRPRVSQVQHGVSNLKKKVGDAQKKHTEAIEAELKRRQEAVDKAAASSLVEKVSAEVAAVEEKVSKALPAAEAVVTSKGSDQENPLKALVQVEKDLEATVAAVEEVLGHLKAHLDDMKASQGPFTEARAQIVKFKVKVGALDAKCKKQVGAVQAARKEVATAAHTAVLDALRAYREAKNIKADELVKELSKDGGDVTAASLRALLSGIADSKLKASDLDIGLDRYTAGITKLALLDILQDYQKCVKEIAITTTFQVKETKTIRKLAVGEIVEVLEAAKNDETSSLPRIRCRTLTDKKEGFVSLRGNQGSSFLEKCSKPYYCCEEEAALNDAFEITSAEVRKIQPGEVLEVLEGPCKAPPQETQRARCRASKDGKTGWVTIKDAGGNSCLERAKLLVCRSPIAITTAFDIGEGKALRKLDVGETLEILGEPNTDSGRELTRINARTKSDGKEGWVTMKGNQGTSYVEETEKHYICKQTTVLENRLPSGSGTVRSLEVGEAIELLDGPKTETKEGPQRVKGRNLADNSEGWFTLSAKNFHPWAPTYKVAQSTVLNDVLEIKDGKTVRKVEAGELLDALETPVLDKTAGLLRVRVRAEKDGATGFATIRGNQGTVLLKPVLGEA